MSDAKPDDGQTAHMFKHRMDIQEFHLRRPLVGEHFHLVNQFTDSVCFTAYQLGQFAVFNAAHWFQATAQHLECRTAGS